MRRARSTAEARRAVIDRAATAAGESCVRTPLQIQEAQRLGHDYLGCEHLLLGILAHDDVIAAKILADHGVTLEVARRRTAEIIGVREGGRKSQGLSYTPRANVVCKLAEVEAERLGEVRPKHAHLWPPSMHVIQAIHIIERGSDDYEGLALLLVAALAAQIPCPSRRRTTAGVGVPGLLARALRRVEGSLGSLTIPLARLVVSSDPWQPRSLRTTNCSGPRCSR